MSRDSFAEELFDAITEMDDFLILEAENALLDEEESKASSSNVRVISGSPGRRNRTLMIAACFTFLIVVSVPVISLMNGEFAGFATKDEASDEEILYDSYAEEDAWFADDAATELRNEASDSMNGEQLQSQGVHTTAHPNIRVMREKWGEFTISVNFYYDYILDDPAKDPQGVLSTMEVTEIREKSYYIVLVRDERIKVYDAKTLEPLWDKEGTSVEDIALELDIAG